MAPPASAGGRVLTIMDVVTIRIVGAPDLDTTARVETDGSIAFPYLGRIRAAHEHIVASVERDKARFA